jgi:hypothetical protein
MEVLLAAMDGARGQRAALQEIQDLGETRRRARAFM